MLPPPASPSPFPVAGDADDGADVEELDVLVVGAGISGIGAGHYLKAEHPSKTFAILEGRAASGGTWDLFRYPGIRSDSDLHTFGYEFKPWLERESIATADRILAYLRETATEDGLDDHVRFHHRVVAADWSSRTARWTVEVERLDTGKRLRLRAWWLFCASGYFRYDEGYTPQFAGRDRFRGPVVHPQHWPEDLEYAGKRVLVIGSGATAVTLVPAMAETAGHVTMLQRTPTYVMPVAREDGLAIRFRRWFGDERGYALARRKAIAQQRLVWLFCRRYPKAARALIRRVNVKVLPDGYPVDEHFNPPYDPWDQRLCAVPDGDLFRAIRQGRASVVTDHVATFTERGVLLASGRELEADVVVTATGLNLEVFGGIELWVDGVPVSVPERLVYRGVMLSGVPNFAIAIGYTNASWTLKVGLLCEHFCRLLAHLDQHGYDAAWPVAPAGVATRPLLDFGAGYVQRSLASLPRQGPRAPWLMSMNYQDDRRLLRSGAVVDDHLRLARAGDPGPDTGDGGRQPASGPEPAHSGTAVTTRFSS